MNFPAGVDRLVAPNPDPYTLSGTNTWLVSDTASATTVLVDPGPMISSHVEETLTYLKNRGLDLEAIVLTHGHDDHSDAVDALRARTGAPVRAVDPNWCREASPLTDGGMVGQGTAAMQCVLAPGHTFDSACFVLESAQALLTGDTVLGGSSTMIDHPDGSLVSYFESMTTLQRITSMEGIKWLLPGHGEPQKDAGDVLVDEVRHRRMRVAQVDRLLGSTPDLTDEEVVDSLYPDLNPILREGARQNVAAARELLNSRPSTPDIPRTPTERNSR